MRRWPGLDGAVVIGCAVVVIVAGAVRGAEVWNWILLVLAVDGIYLAVTAAVARWRR